MEAERVEKLLKELDGWRAEEGHHLAKDYTFKDYAQTLEFVNRVGALAEEQNLVFLSSPFSIEAVELLERLNVSQHKVPSGEVTNLPMLEAIARTVKPVLLSSGMSSWEELDQAV